jgi:hypothetical protein
MISSHSLRAFIAASVIAGSCTACDLGPTAQDVVDKAAPAVCDKYKECTGDDLFSLAYAGGTDECVSKSKDALKKKYGDDLDKRSVCDDDQLDQCIKDIKAAACPADKSQPIAVPCDC